MGYENINIEFTEFDPGHEIKGALKELAEVLQFKAPSRSAMKVVFARSKGAITATCRIASCAGVFIADAVSDCPIDAFKKMEKKLRQQIDLWKVKRSF